MSLTRYPLTTLTLATHSNPRHCDKIMLSTRSLTLSEEGGLKATDFVAGVGVETVDFEPPVALVGQVESYLTALLKTQIDSLTNHMDRSIKRYVRMVLF